MKIKFDALRFVILAEAIEKAAAATNEHYADDRNVTEHEMLHAVADMLDYAETVGFTAQAIRDEIYGIDED